MFFQELWDGSKQFRQLFLYNKIFKAIRSMTDDDMGKAEVLWSERNPRLNWHLCPEERCQNLVVRDDYCYLHCHKKGELPSYKWARGKLYRRLMVSVTADDGSIKRSDPQYRLNHMHEAEKVYDEIPAGYTIHFIDGNPFNHKRSNLVMLSRIAAGILMSEGLPVGDALDLDEVLREFVHARCGRGRPRSRWVYSYEDIANAVGVRPDVVHQAVSRGVLEPSKLSSVVEFCKSREKTA